jgi:hypothetical protein
MGNIFGTLVAVGASSKVIKMTKEFPRKKKRCKKHAL